MFRLALFKGVISGVMRWSVVGGVRFAGMD